jgi:excisionase family DNA binding protein
MVKKKAQNLHEVSKMPDDLISQAEAARLRGVSRHAITDLINRGRIPGYAIGGRRLVSRREVVAFKPEVGGRGRRAGGE